MNQKTLLGAACLFAALFIAYFTPVIAGTPVEISQDGENQTLIIDDAPDMKVIAISKDVIVRKRAKEVLAWGGNIIVEGSVEGDVAAIGGSVTQREGGFIGGDVIVFGGKYGAEGPAPMRVEGKDTVMFGMFEEELRGFAKNPSQILTPELSVSFFVQRLLAVMFWFLITMAAATIAPGAVSRAIAGLKLSALKISGFGAAGFILACVAVIVGLGFLPEYVSAIFGLMAFVLVMLAYGFGRVVLHIIIGKFVLERFMSGRKVSESFSILTGVVLAIAMLSFPYVWPIALFCFFSIGTGLVLTARGTRPWKIS